MKRKERQIGENENNKAYLMITKLKEKKTLIII